MKMGQGKQKLASFFKAHPLCCFCGGSKSATTVDHQPARALFDRRQWPEGFAFPACEECNKESRHHEHVLALLVRMNPEDQTDPIRVAELQKYIRAMHNNFSGFVKPLTALERQQFFRQEGIAQPPRLVSGEMEMIGIRAEDTTDAADVVLKKLFRGLHYKHTGRIAPTDGVVFLRWFTNAYEHAAHELGEFIAALPARPAIQRGSKDLSDQFSYLYGVADEEDISSFACVFRNSLLAVSIVSGKPARWNADVAAGRARLLDDRARRGS